MVKDRKRLWWRWNLPGLRALAVALLILYYATQLSDDVIAGGATTPPTREFVAILWCCIARYISHYHFIARYLLGYSSLFSIIRI